MRWPDASPGASAWRLDAPQLVASTASVGGGIGLRDWVLNVQVPRDYARRDVDAHVPRCALPWACAAPVWGC